MKVPEWAAETIDKILAENRCRRCGGIKVRDEKTQKLAQAWGNPCWCEM